MPHSATARPYFSAPGAMGREILASTRQQPSTNLSMTTQEGGRKRKYKSKKDWVEVQNLFRLPGDLRQGNKTKDWHWSGVWQNRSWCDALCPVATNGALDFLAT
ncbi:uncharacterized protein EAE97_001948 [Botrytis byssoidea]|uniref:Uncharacterized protein n=1 Tax=Botrytis byssoidea TaxID=139641 RepID=A0A9P5IVJ2_9HELO|nr:uncharacterized protein EAE97_001948 [Botrytis byssoidea]KAF7952451.1 hypothetical protein EAE97_001948 [Botrytis byssoidea]